MKRIVSLLLAVLLAATLLPGAAFAAEGTGYSISDMYMYDTVDLVDCLDIPEMPFYVEAEVLRPYTSVKPSVIFAWYGYDGRMLGAERVEAYYTWQKNAYYNVIIDNTDGLVGSIKAFVVPKTGGITPLTEPAIIEKDLPNAAISGISVSGSTVSVAATTEVDSRLEVQILDEETNKVLWSGETTATSEDTELSFTVDVTLPKYFIVTGRFYHLGHGLPLNDLYTCLDYTKGYEEFSAKTESDYSADRVIDVGEANDGSFIVLTDDVIRLSQTPLSEAGGSYTFAAGALGSVAAGDKISFKNGDGVYTTIRVAAISANGDGVTVTEDGSAKIADLYSVIKINTPIKAYAADGSTAAVYRFEGGAEQYATDGSDLYSGIEMGPALTSNIQTSFGSLDAQLRAGGQVLAHYDPTIWGEDYLRVDVLSRLSLEGDLTIGSGGWWWEDVMLFPEVSLAGLEIIGHIPLKLMGEFEVDCQTGVNMHIAAEVCAGYSFNTKDGTQKHTSKSITPSDISAQGDISVEVGLRFTVGVELLNDLISASIGVGAGLGANGTIQAAVTPTFNTPEYHACDCCIAGTCYAYFNANINMHYEVSKKIEGDLFDLELIRAEWTIGKIYISLLNDAESIHKGEIVFGWGECPNKKYLVILQTYNNGQQKDGFTVNVLRGGEIPVASGTSTFKTYLYPESYTAEAVVETNEVKTDFVVLNSMAVYLYAKDPILSGSVTDSETNEALSGASVMILKDDVLFQSVQTDSDGGYSVKLPGGAYRVSFTKDGYKPQVRALDNLQEDTGISVALELIKEPGVLSGTVTDSETGEGISGAMITATREGKEPVYTQTGASGAYSVELEEGEYSLSFSHEDYASASGAAAIKSGEESHASAVLEKVLFPLSITVSDSVTGEAIDGASVSVSAEGESVTTAVTVGGGCELKLPNGNYSVTVTAENYTEVTQSVSIDGEETALSVQLAGVLATGYCGASPNYYDVKWVLSADGVMTVFGSGGVRYANYKGLDSRTYDAYKDQIKALVIEEGVTFAEENAFRALTELESVTLPKGFTSLAENVFYECSSLRTVKFPDTLESIGEQAFWKCTSLVSVNLPDSVTVLGSSAFSGCSALQYARLSNALTTISSGAFENCTSLVTLKLPVALVDIENSAFYGCTSLAELNLPNTLLSIDEFAFSRCTSLRDIRIPASVTHIREDAFYGSGAETVWIDPLSTLSVIYAGAFEDCENLTTLYLPASLKDVKNYGFNQYIGYTNPDGSKNEDHIPWPSTVKHVYFGGNEEEWNDLDFHFVWSDIAGSVPKTYSAAQYFGEYSDTVVTLNWKG